MASSRRRAGRSILFSQDLRQHVRVEREVRDEPLHAIVFLLQLTEAPEFAHAQMDELLLTGIEGGVTRVAGRDRRPGCRRLLTGWRIRPVPRRFRPLHRAAPFVEDRRSRHRTPVSPSRRFRMSRLFIFTYVLLFNHFCPVSALDQWLGNELLANIIVQSDP